MNYEFLRNVCWAIAAIGAVCGLLGTYFNTRIPSKAATRDQVKAAVTDSQDKILEKHDQTAQLLSGKLDSARDEILSSLQKKNTTLQDELWQKYPFGYVLFGSAAGDIVSMPFYKGNLQVDAHWEQTRIEPDYANKTVKVTISHPQWKQDSGPQIHINVQDHATSTFPLKKGTPMPFRLVHVLNQPQMLFEVLDDSQRSPV